jgi:tetratricopeptide (TPR) repeat protein
MQKQLATGDAKNEQAMFDRAIGAYKLSSIYLQLDAKEAVRQAEHCLETIDPLYQSNRETFRYVRLRQNCLDNQGEALLAVGRLPEAEQSFREGLKLAERLSMRTPEDLGAKSTLMHGLADVGLVLMERRQWEESKKFLDRSLELYSRTANQFPKDLYFLRDLAIAQERMGRWHQASGDGAGARTWYERALGSWNQWRQIGKDGPFAAYHVAQVERRFTH